MKFNRNTVIYFLLFFILLLFLGLTLLNEEFDLPHHFLNDPPVSLRHRHGEMFLEISFFCLAGIFFFFIYKMLLKKIHHHERQKEILERTFYHDIHNTAVVLHGFARRLQEAGCDKTESYKKLIHQTSRQLLDEIETQRDISSAEKNELPIHPRQINSIDILTEIIEEYRNHSLATNRNLLCDTTAHNIDLVSDKTIIKRVLGNMVKNALEASGDNETIRLGCVGREGEIEFRVHNSYCIPREIQDRIFQFSFTTKEKGRGLGTYSMKLLTEKYLGGRVSFHSSEDNGTTFTARFPIDLNRQNPSSGGH